MKSESAITAIMYTMSIDIYTRVLISVERTYIINVSITICTTNMERIYMTVSDDTSGFLRVKSFAMKYIGIE